MSDSYHASEPEPGWYVVASLPGWAALMARASGLSRAQLPHGHGVPVIRVGGWPAAAGPPAGQMGGPGDSAREPGLAAAESSPLAS